MCISTVQYADSGKGRRNHATSFNTTQFTRVRTKFMGGDAGGGAN